jgi:hypothetical protein
MIPDPVSLEVGKVLAEATAGEVAKSSLKKRLSKWYHRGISHFSVPSGKTLIVVPLRAGQPGMTEDFRAAEAIGDFFTGYGRERGRSWEIRRLGPDEQLTDVD